MSAVSVRPLNSPTEPKSTPSNSARRWIVNSWVDQLLILLTPLIAIPTVLLLYSPRVGISARTISLIVAAFFAIGHHLPGLIRAYGDRELFERFRWRFLLAPPLLFFAYFPLYNYHYGLYRLIVLCWATWHGLMQVYGFVRIYDAKVGSTSTKTAYWDWLLCLSGFIVPLVYRPEQMSNILVNWYASGGPIIPFTALQVVRGISLGTFITVSAGFAANYVVQWRHGPKPNPLKLLMLASGIGTWWFAMLFVENLLLSVALFDICHDVQYLAIVWLYNCRRVNSNPQLGGFLRYVFRRGMVLLYLALIFAYGAIGLVPSLVQDGTVSSIFYGLLFTSTILHYYYDGFIWKVRESANQAGLGLNPVGSGSRARQPTTDNYAHLLKWSPAILIGGLLFIGDLLAPPLTTARKEELSQIYAKSLTGKTALPPRDEEQSWLYSQFQQAQAIAAAVPGDRQARLRAAVMLANFGQNDEAIAALEKLLGEQPKYSEGHAALGAIHLYRGNFEQASASLQAALSYATTSDDRSRANLQLGEFHLRRHDEAAAEAKFQAAVRENPQLKSTVAALRQSLEAPQN